MTEREDEGGCCEHDVKNVWMEKVGVDETFKKRVIGFSI